jgi:hypothetical protein
LVNKLVLKQQNTILKYNYLLKKGFNYARCFIDIWYRWCYRGRGGAIRYLQGQGLQQAG